MDLAAAAGVQRGDVIDQGVGGPGAVAGERHPAPVPGRDLGDRRIDQGYVIRGSIAPCVAGPKLDRERLAGVVAPRRQRVESPGAFERAPGLLLVTVRDHDRRIEADDDDIAQAPPGCPGRRDLAVPARDQVPDMLPGPRPGPADPGQHRGVAPGQRPPHGRVGRHRAEQIALMPQRVDVADRRRPVRDRDRQVRDHPAPVMQRIEPPPGQRSRQAAGQARPVSDQPRHRRPRMRHHPVPAGLGHQSPRPRHRIRVLSAFRSCDYGTSTVQLSQFGRHFSYISAN